MRKYRWNQNQLRILDETSRCVIVPGDRSTGKSTVIVEKIIHYFENLHPIKLLLLADPMKHAEHVRSWADANWRTIEVDEGLIRRYLHFLFEFPKESR